VFEAIDEFFTKVQEVDKKFTVFPHNLSKYSTMNNMPKVIDNPDSIPTKVEDWLDYFLQAKLQFLGGGLYASALLGCSMPLPKILKTLGNRFRETCYGLWHVIIQSECPVLAGWLLFLTNNSNTETLCREISIFIEDIPVGLCWKKISLRTQGKIPKEKQVQALYMYVDKLDAMIAKPKLMKVYAGNADIDHQFLLHVWMHLVLEIDSVLNTQGWKKIEKLRACQAL